MRDQLSGHLATLDLTPDLGCDIGSKRWLRGFGTFLGLGAVALAFWPNFAPLEAAPAAHLDDAVRERLGLLFAVPPAFFLDQAHRQQRQLGQQIGGYHQVGTFKSRSVGLGRRQGAVAAGLDMVPGGLDDTGDVGAHQPDVGVGPDALLGRRHVEDVDQHHVGEGLGKPLQRDIEQQSRAQDHGLSVGNILGRVPDHLLAVFQVRRPGVAAAPVPGLDGDQFPGVAHVPEWGRAGQGQMLEPLGQHGARLTPPEQLFDVGQFQLHIGRPPVAALAGIIMVIGANMVNWKHLSLTLKTTRSDAVVMLATLISTLLFALDTAIYIGIGLSLVLFLRKAVHPRLIELEYDESNGFQEMKASGKRHIPEISIIHLEGDLFFGGTEFMEEEIGEIAKRKDMEVLILRVKRTFCLD
ncbi:MAG: SulP family inorganic anion transporter, partial [Myxococcales bacterium]|nr:SulP family inorganic anion transporter [Myxococcales bacterium]